ncbi:hypothetical protein E2C01_102375 [Portunus trituberculatus]|uniref:Uncharacterized protein n=1 Tax=Portunus trituberculatus TaxID=210409 RepID=A0A5B7KMN4_PORTR|nr:hypothetical protein [Portunus trituberculatus]
MEIVNTLPKYNNENLRLPRVMFSIPSHLSELWVQVSQQGFKHGLVDLWWTVGWTWTHQQLAGDMHRPFQTFWWWDTHSGKKNADTVHHSTKE